MSQVRCRAILSLVIWGAAGIGFVVTFITGDGPAGYTREPARILIGAGFLLGGFVGFYLALWMTRAKVGTPVVADERDEHIASGASRGALVVVLVSILAFTIALWVGYRSAGCVPVGWMWFMGYALVIVGYLSHAVATLVVEPKADGRR